MLEQVRELHPHAKRALLVEAGAWADPPTAEAIRDSMAMGRIDYYAPRPAASRDEVFHQAISNFLLEWATDRRLVPHTVHIVGEEWSGRAYELREVFQRCAVPHTSVKRVASAVGEGSIAIQLIHGLLTSERPHPERLTGDAPDEVRRLAADEADRRKMRMIRDQMADLAPKRLD